MAQEFVNYGGNMYYVYGAFNGDDDPNKEVFRSAFEKYSHLI